MNLQQISNDGKETFLPGGRVTGCYYLIGKPNGLIYIMEGFSTGATTRDITGAAVAVAFGDNNLLPASQVLRRRFPEIQFVIAGDDDYDEFDQRSLYAYEAAVAMDCRVALPVFDRTKVLTSFYDLVQLEGPEVAPLGQHRLEGSRRLNPGKHRR